MLGEFTLIDRYFSRPASSAPLGVGDDAAILTPAAGCELLVSCDTLVEGTHFFAGCDAEALGWKTLAVNVSDIAAMGGTPRWALLALSLPQVDEAWLTAFAHGFYACAEAHGVELVGGDTTRGPLSLTVTVLGDAPAGRPMRRSGALPGDEIWVSGTPGRAALALWSLQGRLTLSEPLAGVALQALHRPQPRLTLGLALRDLANSAIDVSDGLLSDLGHILRASRLAARLNIAVPTELTLAAGAEAAREAFLAGGDDYELLFTASAEKHAQIVALAERLPLPLHCLGHTLAGPPGEIALFDADDHPLPCIRRGYEHFA